MTTSSDRALVDTNVLVYAHYPEADQHAASQALLDRMQNGEIELCVTPQILTEFYAVVTNPRRVTTARQPTEALDAIEQMLAMPGLTLLPLPAAVLPRCMELARRHAVAGARIFDLQLVAAMLVHGLGTIYTFDRSHFEPFAEITVQTP